MENRQPWPVTLFIVFVSVSTVAAIVLNTVGFIYDIENARKFSLLVVFGLVALIVFSILGLILYSGIAAFRDRD